MTAESFLSSAVEVAIGIAGFAGIIAAIRHRDLRTWEPEERLLLRMLLVSSGMSVLFAWTPAVLHEAGLSVPTMWRLSSAFILTFHVSASLYRTRQFRTMRPEKMAPRSSASWNLAIVLLQALNLYLGAAWPYLLGVAGILANAFMFFLVLLLGRGVDTDDTKSGSVTP